MNEIETLVALKYNLPKNLTSNMIDPLLHDLPIMVHRNSATRMNALDYELCCTPECLPIVLSIIKAELIKYEQDPIAYTS